MKNICKVLTVLLLIFALVGCNVYVIDNSSGDKSSENSSTTSSNDSSVELEIEGNPNTSKDTSTDSDKDTEKEENSDRPDEVDPNAPTVYLESERDGDIITVRFMVKNNPGVAAYTLNVAFDKQKVTPKTITAGISSPVVSNLQQPNVTLSGSSVTAVYANTKGFSADGEMFNITFEINDGATGDAEFKIVAEEQDFVAPDYAYVIFQKQNTKISIS